MCVLMCVHVCVLLVPQIELVEDGTPRRLKVDFEFVETKETSSQEFNTVRETYVGMPLLLHTHVAIVCEYIMQTSFHLGSLCHWTRSRH